MLGVCLGGDQWSEEGGATRDASLDDWQVHTETSFFQNRSEYKLKMNKIYKVIYKVVFTKINVHFLDLKFQINIENFNEKAFKFQQQRVNEKLKMF